MIIELKIIEENGTYDVICKDCHPITGEQLDME